MSALDGTLRHVADEVLRDVAMDIFGEEQYLQRFIATNPTDARLAGAMSGLQHARIIVENKAAEVRRW